MHSGAATHLQTSHTEFKTLLPSEGQSLPESKSGLLGKKSGSLLLSFACLFQTPVPGILTLSDNPRSDHPSLLDPGLVVVTRTARILYAWGNSPWSLGRGTCLSVLQGSPFLTPRSELVAQASRARNQVSETKDQWNQRALGASWGKVKFIYSYGLD